MNAWPMMARCWLAQWRGLAPWEQVMLTDAWDKGCGEMTGQVGNSSSRIIPLWWSGCPLQSEMWISVKEDGWDGMS